MILWLSAGTAATNSNFYLDFAEKTAAWLMAKAVASAGGAFSWPTADEQSYSRSGMDQGTAGIGTFFLELYKMTEKGVYLSYAEGAGKSLGAHSYQDGEIDWISGAAGEGCFLIDLWQVAKNGYYLNEARRAADWLIAKHYEDRGGYHWKHYPDYTKIFTGFAHGASGIGYFFARLYKETGDARYLDCAKKAAVWVNSYSWEPGPNLYCWPRLTTDTDPNTSWCGGSVGIILFFLELFDVTGETSYFSWAKGGTDWLVNQAEDGGNGTLKWTKSRGTNDYSDSYCHGNTSVVHILYEMGKRTGDPLYLDYARKGAKWDELNAVTVQENCLRWTHYGYLDTGLLTGTAGVGNALALFYQYDPDPVFLEYARKAAYYLMSVAEYPVFGQAKWLNYLGPYDSQYGNQWHETGWYSGAVGIGLFFLNLGRIHPPPPPQNQPPFLDPIGPKKVKENEKLEFQVSGLDPDGDALVFLCGQLPPGAEFRQRVFSWTPGYGQGGKYRTYFLLTDGYHWNGEEVEIEVVKVKKSLIRK